MKQPKMIRRICIVETEQNKTQSKDVQMSTLFFNMRKVMSEKFDQRMQMWVVQ